MTQTVFVTNRSDTVLRDGYGGVFYDFIKDQTVEVPLHVAQDRKSTRLNSSHDQRSRMPSSA